jgi:hypothetical protein
MNSSIPFIEGRGRDFCRGCLATNLFSAIDLGALPIANELLRDQSNLIEKFPLHLSVCSECGLGQVADVVTPERIFRDYRYLSSMSTTFLNHASEFVERCINENLLSQDDWVLEIASNDGYLLKNFLSLGIKAIGVEPAANVAEISRSLGVETISEFFSSDLASKILIEHGYPKLIIANNVVAHVPDLIDFIKGLAILAGPETRITIENPSLANILLEMQFDTIYHEHYSYLTAWSVSNICNNQGLYLLDIEDLKIHGGSKRYWLGKQMLKNENSNSVQEIINLEFASGIFDQKKWLDFSSKVSNILSGFYEWLQLDGQVDRRVFGYGAAAKASTILNSVDLTPNLIIAIADLSLEKQKRFMPPHGIRIISPEELFAAKPTDVVIFPWNIQEEIAQYLASNLEDDVRLWSVIPEMHQIDLQ